MCGNCDWNISRVRRPRRNTGLRFPLPHLARLSTGSLGEIVRVRSWGDHHRWYWSMSPVPTSDKRSRIHDLFLLVTRIYPAASFRQRGNLYSFHRLLVETNCNFWQRLGGSFVSGWWRVGILRGFSDWEKARGRGTGNIIFVGEGVVNVDKRLD